MDALVAKKVLGEMIKSRSITPVVHAINLFVNSKGEIPAALSSVTYEHLQFVLYGGAMELMAVTLESVHNEQPFVNAWANLLTKIKTHNARNGMQVSKELLTSSGAPVDPDAFEFLHWELPVAANAKLTKQQVKEKEARLEKKERDWNKILLGIKNSQKYIDCFLKNFGEMQELIYNRDPSLFKDPTISSRVEILSDSVFTYTDKQRRDPDYPTWPTTLADSYDDLMWHDTELITKKSDKLPVMETVWSGLSNLLRLSTFMQFVRREQVEELLDVLYQVVDDVLAERESDVYRIMEKLKEAVTKISSEAGIDDPQSMGPVVIDLILSNSTLIESFVPMIQDKLPMDVISMLLPVLPVEMQTTDVGQWVRIALQKVRRASAATAEKRNDDTTEKSPKKTK